MCGNFGNSHNRIYGVWVFVMPQTMLVFFGCNMLVLKMAVSQTKQTEYIPYAKMVRSIGCVPLPLAPGINPYSEAGADPGFREEGFEIVGTEGMTS